MSQCSMRSAVAVRIERVYLPPMMLTTGSSNGKEALISTGNWWSARLLFQWTLVVRAADSVRHRFGLPQ